MTHGSAAPAHVGRVAEVERLNRLARRVAGGTGAAAFVEGEPGIGKSSLLAAVAAECERLGMRVVCFAAEVLEQRLPFATISAGLGIRAEEPEPAVARVARLLRGEGAWAETAAAANHEFAVNEAILDLVDGWCAEGPTALIVDDVQWADPASVVVLHRLGRSIAQQPLLLVVAADSLARSEQLGGLARSLVASGAESLELGPLPPAAVDALVERLLASPPSPELRALAACAGGNPMYVVELVAALDRDGSLDVSGGGGCAAPKSLVEMICQRLYALPPDTHEPVKIAAVFGTTIDLAELSTILDLPIATLWEIATAAIDAGLVVNAGDRLVFRHEIIRSALAEAVPASVRTALHRQAGAALAEAGAPVQRVAEHLRAGGTLDRAAVEWLVRAANQLIVRAPQLAVALLRQALPITGGETAHLLRFHLVRALLWAGSQTEAEHAARSALAVDDDPTRRGALHWLLAQACFRQGHLDDAIAVAAEALASGQLTPAEEGRFHGLTAICLLFEKRLEEMEAAAAMALAAGEVSGDQIAIGYGLYAHAAWCSLRGRPTEGLAFADQALLRFAAGNQPDLQVDPNGVRGYCLIELDRLAEADEALAIAVRNNLLAGGAYLGLNQLGRVRLRFLDGRWDDALVEVQAGLDMADPLGYTPSLRWLAALIGVHRGTDVEVVATPDERPGRSFGYLTYWAMALAQEALQQPERAAELLVRTEEAIEGLVPSSFICPIYPDIARLAFLLDDRDRAAEIAVASESLAEREPTPGRRGTALLCRGLADRDPGPLLAAVDAFRAAGRPLHEAYAHENAAVVLAQLGQATEARAALDRALARYRELEAAWDIARTEARLREVGIRRGQPGPRRRPKTGWPALTDTERKVALLVAEGRSNADIATHLYLSRRTVQSHVSSMFTKLGVTSRVELAMTVSRHAA